MSWHLVTKYKCTVQTCNYLNETNYVTSHFIWVYLNRCVTEWFQKLLKTLENFVFPVLYTDITLALYLQTFPENNNILLKFPEIWKFPENGISG